MLVDEFEQHARDVGLTVNRVEVGTQSYVHLSGVKVVGGTHDGQECDVAILRTRESPWVPQTAVHVRPHLTPMGQLNSQASPVGSDWQYLSRRFDRVPTPKSFLAHILTVLAEL